MFDKNKEIERDDDEITNSLSSFNDQFNQLYKVFLSELFPDPS